MKQLAATKATKLELLNFKSLQPELFGLPQLPFSPASLHGLALFLLCRMW